MAQAGGDGIYSRLLSAEVTSMWELKENVRGKALGGGGSDEEGALG